MKRTSLSIFLYLTLVFASGMAVGGFGHWLYASRAVNAKAPRLSPDDYRHRYVEEMKSRLVLDSQQVEQLNTILDATRQRYRDLRARHKPDYAAIQQEQVRQVRGLLRPSQLPEYEKVQAERAQHEKEREKEYEKRRHGPGGF